MQESTAVASHCLQQFAMWTHLQISAGNMDIVFVCHRLRLWPRIDFTAVSNSYSNVLNPQHLEKAGIVSVDSRPLQELRHVLYGSYAGRTPDVVIWMSNEALRSKAESLSFPIRRCCSTYGRWATANLASVATSEHKQHDPDHRVPTIFPEIQNNISI